MTKLSDTQAVILSAAAQREDGNVLPLPGSLRGGAATKVVGALLSRGLVEERVTESLAQADPALNRVWRNDTEGRAVILTITDAGLAATGVESPRVGRRAPTAPLRALRRRRATLRRPTAPPAGLSPPQRPVRARAPSRRS
jgi:hypothetical protein